MKPSDLYESLTLGGITESDEPMLIQKEQASFGIAWVIVGFIQQSINTFVIVDSFISFFGWMIFTAIVLGMVCHIVYLLNARFRKEYEEFKKPQKR